MLVEKRMDDDDDDDDDDDAVVFDYYCFFHFHFQSLSSTTTASGHPIVDSCGPSFLLPETPDAHDQKSSLSTFLFKNVSFFKTVVWLLY